MEKSWQTSFEIDPALVAHSDYAVRAETGSLISDGHSDENASWMRTFFPTSMTAKYGRAHTVFLGKPLLPPSPGGQFCPVK